MVRQFQNGYSQILIIKLIIQWKTKGPLRNIVCVYDKSYSYLKNGGKNKVGLLETFRELIILIF